MSEIVLSPRDVLALLKGIAAPPEPNNRLKDAVARANRVVRKSIDWAGRGDWCEGRIDGQIAFWIVREGPSYTLNSLEKTEGSYPTLREAQDGANGN